MQLTHELLLPYEGFRGANGVCHVRVYEEAGRPPIVIAGVLDDGPGTSVTNAIEMVADAIQARFFPDGRKFELIEYHPCLLDGRDPPIFSRVDFEHRRSGEPSWTRIADIERLVGCEVKLWPAGEYTAGAVAGTQGQELRDEIAAKEAP